MKKKPMGKMAASRAIRTLNPNLSDDKEREMFYFMQIFHPERGEKANREMAREAKAGRLRGVR